MSVGTTLFVACDVCGARSEYSDHLAVIRKMAALQGYQHVVDEDDYHHDRCRYHWIDAPAGWFLSLVTRPKPLERFTPNRVDEVMDLVLFTPSEPGTVERAWVPRGDGQWDLWEYNPEDMARWLAAAQGLR